MTIERTVSGGWCAAGRLAEDGTIPDRYRLVETPDAVYAASLPAVDHLGASRVRLYRGDSRSSAGVFGFRRSVAQLAELGQIPAVQFTV